MVACTTRRAVGSLEDDFDIRLDGLLGKLMRESAAGERDSRDRDLIPASESFKGLVILD